MQPVTPLTSPASTIKPPTGKQLAAMLTSAVRRSIGEEAFDLDGRLRDWRHAILPPAARDGIDKVERLTNTQRLRQPDGGPAMAVNGFLFWRDLPQHMNLAGFEGFKELRFDARCPTGIRGTPPHLDLISSAEGRVVAVTARPLNYLSRNSRKFAAAYNDIEVPRNVEPWLAVRGDADGSGKSFRRVDTTSLFKFALGLARTFPAHQLRLLYLFWEPEQADQLPQCRQHRQELAELKQMVDGSAVELHALSFDELWQSWLDASDNSVLQDLVAQLRSRYTVSLSGFTDRTQ